MSKQSGRRISLLLACALLLACLAGCGNGNASNGNEGNNQASPKVLKVGTDFSAFETMDVQKTTYTTPFEISDCVCETLMGKDPETLETYPLLVEDFPKVSEDGLTYTFTLKKDVKFHDGTTLNTDDVIYTFHRFFDPSTICPMTWLVDMIAGAQDYMNGTADSISGLAKVDDRTFTMTLNFPYSAMEATLAASPLAIFSDEACQAAGDRWGADSYVGTGPFVFTSFAAGEKIVLTRFADYHGEAKRLDEIDVFCMDSNTALMEFEAGTIDVCGLSAELAQDYKASAEYGDNVHYQDYFGIYTMIINQEVEPFNDPLVRQAFALAVDKQAIANDYYDGSVSAAYSFLPPGISGHDDALKELDKRDVEKAKALLTQAGYADGITITTYIPTADAVMTILQQQLAEANIHLDVQLADAATVSDMRVTGKLACWLLTWYADYNDADEFFYGVFNSNVADFFSTGWRNAEFDATLEQCRAINDMDEKAEIYRQLDREITWEQYGNVPLYYPGGFYLTSDRVSNVFMKNDFLWWWVDGDIVG